MALLKFTYFYITRVRAGYVRVGIADSRVEARQGRAPGAVLVCYRTFSRSQAQAWVQWVDRIFSGLRTHTDYEYRYKPRMVARVRLGLKNRHISNFRLAAWFMAMFFTLLLLLAFVPFSLALRGWAKTVAWLIDLVVINPHRLSRAR